MKGNSCANTDASLFMAKNEPRAVDHQNLEIISSSNARDEFKSHENTANVNALGYVT